MAGEGLLVPRWVAGLLAGLAAAASWAVPVSATALVLADAYLRHREGSPAGIDDYLSGLALGGLLALIYRAVLVLF